MNRLSQTPPIFDHMTALADRVRARILLLLERHELTVSELCAIVQLPQSTTSRHLKILADDGWVVSRRNGTHRLYRSASGDLAPEATRLWELIRDQVAAEHAHAQDTRRLDAVLADRRLASKEFFSSSAGEWDRLRDELFGGRFWLVGLLGLLDEQWVLGDLGCGTGRIAGSLAPFVERVIAVDDSDAMLEAAAGRLEGAGNVELRRGDLAELPIDDDELDAATLVLVLHHVPDPATVLKEVARTLGPGGRLLIVDMLPHDRSEFQQQMGHVWAGFSEEQIERHAGEAGLAVTRFAALPVEADARGPALFAASCRLDAIAERS